MKPKNYNYNLFKEISLFYFNMSVVNNSFIVETLESLEELFVTKVNDANRYLSETFDKSINEYKVSLMK